MTVSSLAFSTPLLFPFSSLRAQMRPTNKPNKRNIKINIIMNMKLTTSSQIKRISSRAVPCFTAAEEIPVASRRLETLVTEFEALTEPIERVKRLLDYATRLPPFDESARTPKNRVTGCTTQVWIEARVDEKGRMRFRGDSDSEITKGFISCLIWLLDGAKPEEVVAVKAEELAAVNVGMYGKEQSRVNTWHNVLSSMQRRTEALLKEAGWEKMDAKSVRS